MIVTYDPVNGPVVSDSHILQFSKRIIKDRENTSVGSELIINQIRLLIKENFDNISHKDISFEFYTDNHLIDIRIDQFGNLEEWPEGFCDYYENILLNLLG